LDERRFLDRSAGRRGSRVYSSTDWRATSTVQLTDIGARREAIMSGALDAELLADMYEKHVRKTGFP